MLLLPLVIFTNVAIYYLHLNNNDTCKGSVGVIAPSA